MDVNTNSVVEPKKGFNKLIIFAVFLLVLILGGFLVYKFYLNALPTARVGDKGCSPYGIGYDLKEGVSGYDVKSVLEKNDAKFVKIDISENIVTGFICTNDENRDQLLIELQKDARFKSVGPVMWMD